MPGESSIVASQMNFDAAIKKTVDDVLGAHDAELSKKKTLTEKVDFVSICVFNELSSFGLVFDDSVYNEISKRFCINLDEEIMSALKSYRHKPEHFEMPHEVQNKLKAFQIFEEITRNLNPSDYELAKNRIDLLTSKFDKDSDAKRVGKSELSNPPSQPNPMTALDVLAFAEKKKRAKIANSENPNDRARLVKELEQLRVEQPSAKTQTSDSQSKQGVVHASLSREKLPMRSETLDKVFKLEALENKIEKGENLQKSEQTELEKLQKWAGKTLLDFHQKREVLNFEEYPKFAILIHWKLRSLNSKLEKGHKLSKAEMQIDRDFSKWINQRLLFLERQVAHGKKLINPQIAEREILEHCQEARQRRNVNKDFPKHDPSAIPSRPILKRLADGTIMIQEASSSEDIGKLHGGKKSISFEGENRVYKIDSYKGENESMLNWWRPQK